MKKNTAVLFGIGIVVIIVLAVWVGVLIAGMQSGSSPDGASPYSAVYLSTGDMYFGKLSWFPSPHMTDVWHIVQSPAQNGGQPQIGFVPVESLSYGPVDEVDFNAQDIVFSTRLRNNSQFVQAMENPQAQQGGAGNAPGSASSTAPSLPMGASATSTR